MLFADLALAQRLEGCDTWSNAQCIQTYARLYPTIEAVALPVAGGYAMYAGVHSPLTQAIGLGMNGRVAATELDQVEEFYRARNTTVQVELCPLADPSLRALLTKRDYRVEEYSNVLARPLSSDEPGAPVGSEVQVRAPLPEEAELWARTVVEGFAEEETGRSSLVPVFLTFFHVPSTTCFLATLDGQPAGGGVAAIYGGVAALFGASTRSAFRNRGVQSALLRARLAFALDAGCDLAMVVTLPGTTSQRNAERQGFHVMYTRSKMSRE